MSRGFGVTGTLSELPSAPACCWRYRFSVHGSQKK